MHETRYAAGSAMAAHSHDEPWLCLVMEGGYEERIRDRTAQHAPGDLLFCPAHAPHEQRFGASGALKILFSPGRAALDYLADQGVDLEQAPSLMRSAPMLRFGARLRHELHTDDAFAPLARESLALELLAALGCDRSARPSPAAPAWLRRLKDCLDEDAAADRSLHQLAAIAERHPVHLARSFRAHYGCTLGGYLRKRRADKAALLLRLTRRALIDIAVDCGYADAAHFSRSFRAAYGIAPSAYRERSR
jgi:AraC family transcriptional regulator